MKALLALALCGRNFIETIGAAAPMRFFFSSKYIPGPGTSLLAELSAYL
jgi:hypothetical protein